MLDPTNAEILNAVQALNMAITGLRGDVDMVKHDVGDIGRDLKLVDVRVGTVETRLGSVESSVGTASRKIAVTGLWVAGIVTLVGIVSPLVVSIVQAQQPRYEMRVIPAK